MSNEHFSDIAFSKHLQLTFKFEYYCYAHWGTILCNILFLFISSKKTPWKRFIKNCALMLLLKYTLRINILCFNVLSSKSRTSPCHHHCIHWHFSVYHHYYHDQHIHSKLNKKKPNFHDNISFYGVFLVYTWKTFHEVHSIHFYQNFIPIKINIAIAILLSNWK